MNCNIIDDLSAINFCDGTYIGPGSSFDISTNQHLKVYANTTTFILPAGSISINSSGAIGLGAIPDYGTADAVLMSSCPTALASWSVPYYFRAYLTNDQTISEITWTDLINYTIDTSASTFNASSEFNASTGVWTPGIRVYMIYTSVKIGAPTGTSPTDSNIVRTILGVRENANLIRTIDSMNELNNNGADIFTNTPNFTDTLYTDGSNTYKIQAYGDRLSGSGGLRIHGKSSTTQEGTFFGAYKIG